MTDPVIHVSFPQPPDRYPATRHWHAQISHFVFRALAARFGRRVAFSPWEAPLAPAGRDVLVSFLPHPALKVWKRSVLVENSTFATDKWRYEAFRRFGLDAPLDPVRETHAWLEHQYALVVLSNDVAMRRVAANDPLVAECHAWMRGAARHLSIHPHPIDKPEFARLRHAVPDPAKVRMLIYHGGPRKNSAELIDTMRALNFQENNDFAVVRHVVKDREDLLRFIRENFLIVANTSFSETGPINMIEYLVSGHLIYGHEDWWDGLGNPRLGWSYDPARMAANHANLLHVMRDLGPAGVIAERDRAWRAFMARTDNEWPAITGLVVEHVAALLDNDHPGHATEPIP